jgi:hypothetical protein
MKTKNLVILFLLPIMLIGCTKSPVPDEPKWVQDMVTSFAKEAIGSTNTTLIRFITFLPNAATNSVLYMTPAGL